MYLQSQQNYAKATPFYQHNTFVNNLLASTTETQRGSVQRQCYLYVDDMVTYQKDITWRSAWVVFLVKLTITSLVYCIAGNFCKSPTNTPGKMFAILSFVTRSQSRTTPHTISHMEMMTLAVNSSCIVYPVLSSLGNCICCAVVENAVNTSSHQTDLWVKQFTTHLPWSSIYLHTIWCLHR